MYVFQLLNTYNSDSSSMWKFDFQNTRYLRNVMTVTYMYVFLHNNIFATFYQTYTIDIATIKAIQINILR